MVVHSPFPAGLISHSIINMDVAANSIALFQTAYKAYQIISKAVEIEAEAIIWDVLMRVERTRFEVWGRTLGFLDAESGEIRDDGLITDLGMVLQIDSAQALVQDLLASIASVLEKFQKSAEKYELTPNTATANKRKDSSTASPRGQSGRKSKRVDALWKSTKSLMLHISLVINDESMIKNLIKNLAQLNDGLEKVLSLTQKVQATRALAAGVLPAYQTPEELDTFINSSDARGDGLGSEILDFSQKSNLLAHHHALLATARIKYRCVEMAVIDPNRSPPTSWHRPNDVTDVSTVKVDNYELPSELLKLRRIPQRAPEEVLWPDDVATYTASTEAPADVLVEWRQQSAISPGFSIPGEEMTQRRNLLVRLLHEASTIRAGSEYRVLDCLGYIKVTGRVEGEPTPVIGFISRVPYWADGSRLPISLHQLMQDAFQNNDSSITPSLRVRFQLAKQISSSLYQLQCSQWLHRNMCSSRVMFFYEKATRKLRIDSPFLTGLQYSRPDDQSPIDKERRFRSDGFNIQGDNWGSLGLYLHPDFSSPKARRYRRSDDIYSLGVILFEIAFWEPVEVFRNGSEKIPLTAEKILKVAKTELSAEVGEFYRDAVVKCLEGLRGDIRKEWLQPTDEELLEAQDYEGEYQGEDPEHGLEEDLLWKVVREIEKCVV
jgi:hypothetical protein